MPTYLLDTALRHAAAGWAVFPVIDKKPATDHGFHDAVTEPDEIRELFDQCPDANGVGGAVAAGYIVADGDLRHGQTVDSLADALRADYGIDVEETYAIRTGSGGIQCVYRDPEGSVRQTQNVPGHYVDTRIGGRGYVVLPGSAHPSGGTYEVLHELPLADVPEVPAKLVDAFPRRDYGDRGAETLAERMVEWTDADGEPCEQLRRVADHYIALLAEGTDRHQAAVRAQTAIVADAEKGHRGAITALESVEAAFLEAKPEGGEEWSRALASVPITPNLLGELDRCRCPNVAAADDSADVEPDDDTDDRLSRLTASFIDWRALLTKPLPPPDWLWEPIIEKGKAVAIYSEAKAGKSLLALEAVCAMAAGRPAFGLPGTGERRKVLYLDLENTSNDLHERVVAMGFSWEDLDGWLHYASFPSLSYLDTPEGGAEVVALAELVGAELVVIDTLSRVTEGDENDAKTYHRWYKYTGLPLKRAGRAVVRLDHTGKDSGKGMRGSSAKRDDVDAVWSLTAAGDLLTLERTHGRSNHGASIVRLQRLDNPLRHVEWRTPATIVDPVDQAVSVLVRTGFDGGVRDAQKVLKEHGFTQRVARAAHHRWSNTDDDTGTQTPAEVPESPFPTVSVGNDTP